MRNRSMVSSFTVVECVEGVESLPVPFRLINWNGIQVPRVDVETEEIRIYTTVLQLIDLPRTWESREIRSHESLSQWLELLVWYLLEI